MENNESSYDKLKRYLQVKAVKGMSYVGYDFNGYPDKKYIEKYRKSPGEVKLPIFPLRDNLSYNGEQAVLILPNSVQETKDILNPLLRRFPNHLLIGSRRDIVRSDPNESREMLLELYEKSYNYIKKRREELGLEKLTVVGICAGASVAAYLAKEFNADNLYLMLAAGRISDGVWTSYATQDDAKKAEKKGFPRQDFHDVLKDFDPLTHLEDCDIKNIYGVFAGEDLMVPRASWHPLAYRTQEIKQGNVLVYQNIGHIAGMIKASRDLERRVI
jgi:pimeloyl-ACP methyl ester carboxylesterase